MGVNSSINSQIQQNEKLMEESNGDSDNDSPQINENADYYFEETENIKSLPPVDEPIRTIDNPAGINTVLRKKIRAQSDQEKLDKYIPLESKAIDLIAEGKNILIDEQNFQTIISIINSLIQDYNILIISQNTLIGHLYEYYNNSTTNIGIITKKLVLTNQYSNFIDIELFDTIDFSSYQIFIILIDKTCQIELLRNTMTNVATQNKPIIIYRLSSNGFADDIFIDELPIVPEHLINQSPINIAPTINCIKIDFDHCVDLKFSSLDEACKILKKKCSPRWL